MFIKIDKQFFARMNNVSEKDFFNFYFLNLDNSLIIHDPEFRLFICIANIVIEETMSQNFYKGPSSFSVKFRKKY